MCIWAQIKVERAPGQAALLAGFFHVVTSTQFPSILRFLPTLRHPSLDQEPVEEEREKACRMVGGSTRRV